MAGLVLDAGALIAFERDDRRFATIWKRAQQQGAELVVPVPVIAQVWRGNTQVKLRRFLNSVAHIAMTTDLAYEAGNLCRLASTTDTVDAVVAAVAHRSQSDVVTGDPTDIRSLLQALGSGCGVVTV